MMNLRLFLDKLGKMKVMKIFYIDRPQKKIKETYSTWIDCTPDIYEDKVSESNFLRFL